MSRKLSTRGCASSLAASALLLCLHGAPVQAEYIDPIDLPSIKMASAQQSLLLDVTRAGERLIAAGERGHILYSDNQGDSWTQADVATRSQINSLFFVDSNNGWAVGEDQTIIYSTDGGRTWNNKQDGRDADQRGPLLDLTFNSAREGYAIGVFNKLVRTTDGGQSWEPWQDNIDNLDEWHLFSITSVGEEHLYITSEMGLVFRSLNGGETFEPVQTDHDGSFHGILARQDDEGNDQLVLFGVGGVLYTTTDSGETWNYHDTGVKTGLAGGAWLADGSALIVGADGVVLHLDNGLTELSLHPIANGLPLNAVAVDGGKVTLVGLGGIQSYTLEQLLGGDK